VKLSPTSYVVLGLVASAGRSTPYDLKRLLARSVGHFWSFPHAQLYAEPARLAAAGLLTEEREEGGRNRRYYTITPAGREAVQAWLQAPTAALGEIRDPGLLKLFFAGLGSRADLAALAEAQLGAHRAQLATYERLAAELEHLPGNDLRIAPLQMGLRFERTAVEFWADVARSAGSVAARAARKAPTPPAPARVRHKTA
jgi:DNA-binding PadR family transcriptional regulator